MSVRGAVWRGFSSSVRGAFWRRFSSSVRGGKLQADSKNGVEIENQAKNYQVMGPQKGLIFEKNLFYPKGACP